MNRPRDEPTVLNRPVMKQPATLVNDRNGGRLRLIATRTDDDDDCFICYI